MIDPSHQPGAHRSLQLSATLAALLGLLLLVGMLRDGTGFQQYHALQSVLEIIAIAVSAMVFALGWHTHEPNQRATTLPCACLMLGVALLHTSHLLSHQGMPDFLTPNGAEKASDFRLAACTLCVLALLSLATDGLSPLARLSRWMQLGLVLGVVLLLHLVVLLRPEWTPATYVPGLGLTPFKQAFEALLIGLLLLAAWGFTVQLRRPQQPGAAPPAPLLGATLVLAASGVCVILYVDLTGFHSALGQGYQVVGYVLLYRAVFVAQVELPIARLRAPQAERPAPLFEVDAEGRYLRVDTADPSIRTAPEVLIGAEVLSAAVEQDPKPVLISGLDGSVEYVNPAFTRVTGYSHAEMRGRNPRILQSGRTAPEVYTAMWARLSAGAVWRGELVNRRRDGREYVADTQIYPVRDRSGRISHYLAHSEDISERKAAAERIRQLSNYDQLTGLANPTLLRERARLALEAARREGHALAVIHIDLDHTKAVNDSLGHAQGDLLLMEIAGRLARVAGEGDTVGRISGDEFAFIAPDAGPMRAGQLGFRLVNTIAEPLQLAGQELVITASIGIALYPQDGEDFETLAKNADVAMRRLKQDARNGYRFFTADREDRSERLLGLRSALHQAMARQQLKVVYQPQIALGGGSAVAVEALLRWQHPRWGEVSPAEFIPIAEETGLIVSIGSWVLEVALQQLSRWQHAGLHDVVVAVNVSAVQFRDPAFLGTVERLLAESRANPAGLELELTEAVAMRDPATVVAIIDQLHRRGVRISIDDFGTGYSSLSQLKRFRISTLKIDQSFIRELPTDAEDQAIVTAIIQMAHSLGMRTLAEGVETAAQLAFLHAQGCDGVQGHFYSRALDAAAAEQFLRAHQHPG